jgi:hypothetical protein
MSLSTSFSVGILLMQTKRATERKERDLLGMAFLKGPKWYFNKKEVIIYIFCVPHQRQKVHL